MPLQFFTNAALIRALSLLGEFLSTQWSLCINPKKLSSSMHEDRQSIICCNDECSRCNYYHTLIRARLRRWPYSPFVLVHTPWLAFVCIHWECHALYCISCIRVRRTNGWIKSLKWVWNVWSCLCCFSLPCLFRMIEYIAQLIMCTQLFLVRQTLVWFARNHQTKGSNSVQMTSYVYQRAQQESPGWPAVTLVWLDTS